MASSTEDNRATAIKFIKRMKICRGIDLDLVTEDFQWWSPGSGYFNAQQMNAVIGTLDSIMPRMPDMTIDATTAEGDRIALEVSGKCELSNGRRYDNMYHFLILLRDGRVQLVKEYLDTKVAHEAFGP
jgi:ketosteroid isomerase-like protein